MSTVWQTVILFSGAVFTIWCIMFTVAVPMLLLHPAASNADLLGSFTMMAAGVVLATYGAAWLIAGFTMSRSPSRARRILKVLFGIAIVTVSAFGLMHIVLMAIVASTMQQFPVSYLWWTVPLSTAIFGLILLIAVAIQRRVLESLEDSR